MGQISAFLCKLVYFVMFSILLHSSGIAYIYRQDKFQLSFEYGEEWEPKGKDLPLGLPKYQDLPDIIFINIISEFEKH